MRRAVRRALVLLAVVGFGLSALPPGHAETPFVDGTTLITRNTCSVEYNSCSIEWAAYNDVPLETVEVTFGFSPSLGWIYYPANSGCSSPHSANNRNCVTMAFTPNGGYVFRSTYNMPSSALQRHTCNAVLEQARLRLTWWGGQVTTATSYAVKVPLLPTCYEA